MTREVVVRRRTLLGSGLAVAVALVPVVLTAVGCEQAPPEPQPKPHHVRVVWTESPQNRATVLWSTETAGGEHRLHWDTDSRGAEGAGKYAHTIVSSADERYPGEHRELYCHRVELTGLPSGTTVHFAVEQGRERTREFHFDTAPADGRSFSVLNGGDSRSDRGARQRVNRKLAEIAAADRAVLALAHGGDYVYSGTSQKLWLLWLDDYELTIPDSGRLLPILPARGNHESEGPLFDVIFGKPGGGIGQNWFATKLSADVLLVTLNTETAAGGRQQEFLAKTLEQHRAVRWQLANYHRPIWPAVKTPGAGKVHWMPLFDKFSLDLALESDGHTLKRTVPIRDEKQDPTGVVYIGEGGFGVKQRTPETDRWYLQSPGFADSSLHIWRLDFSAEKLVAKALLLDGTVRDVVELNPRKRPLAVESQPAQPQPAQPQPAQPQPAQPQPAQPQPAQPQPAKSR